MRLLICTALILSAFGWSCRSGGAPQQVYPKEEFLYREGKSDGQIYRYRVYVPSGIHSNEKLPAMLYLHGAGNRGDDNESQLNGLAETIRERHEQFKFIVVIPQCPAGRFWDEQMIGQAIMALDDTVADLNADPDRLYLAGFSLGGFGVWNTAAMYPEKFSAIVPMSGRVLPRQQEMKRVSPIIAQLARAEDPYKGFAER